MLTSKAKWNFIKSEKDKHSTSLIDILLQQRGVQTEEEIKKFLQPNVTDLICPSNLAMIDVAAKRVHRAIENAEKILVFGDYDADGVCSTALLMQALQELGATCEYYIPNRFTEGYGPNEQAFNVAYENGTKLIITVDTGIASVHEASIAKELGMDLIITDHHEIQTEVPDAFAIIHPKYSPAYAFKDLAGVGVAFKFAQYLLGYFPKHLLDLVAIGTIADLVPLIEENRILAYYGLRSLTATENIGLQALKNICTIDGTVTEEDVGFVIAPRLNAVGRLQSANLVVQLLMTVDQQEALEIAKEINTLNQQRQQIVAKIVKEAEQMLGDEQQNGIIIVYKEGWNEGVLGIVASRLVQKYDRPAMVLTLKKETSELKGSARSIPAFDLFQNCMKIRQLFTHFGGHSQAAGMTFPTANVQQIKDKLNEQIQMQLNEDDFKQVICINKTIQLSDINETLVNDIYKLAPFGMKNPKPVFHLKEIPAQMKQMGTTKNHLKLQFKHNEQWMDGVGFQKGSLYYRIAEHTPVSIVGELGINEWNGNKKLQMIIQDISVDEWQLFDHRGRNNRTEISSYLIPGKRHLLIGNQSYSQYDYMEQITYETNVETLPMFDVIFIFDLPPSFDVLKAIIQKTNPTVIHVNYYVQTSTYLGAFPDRSAFKWLYALLVKRKQIDLNKDQTYIMKYKGWSQDRISFIVNVFLELGFVTMQNNIIKIATNIKQQQLNDSKLYRQHLLQSEIEKELYYSNYQQLKNWFSQCLASVEFPEEEVVYGI